MSALVKKYLFLCLLGLACAAFTSPINAMDVDPLEGPVDGQVLLRTPTKTYLVSNPEIQPTILKSLERALRADHAAVAIDSFILTDPKIIKCIIAIHHKNPNAVTVHLHESNSHNKKTIEQLQEEGVAVAVSAQHAKRLCIEFKDDHETLWHRHIISGSYNLTNNARNNAELMVVDVNDSPTHKAHKQSHMQGTKRDRNQSSDVLVQTPERKLVIDNATHDLHASLVPRIANTNAGDTLYFASMNYGEKRLHQAFLEAAKRKVLIHMLLDVDSVRHIEQLNELAAHGANIAFPTGEFNIKDNVKLFTKVGIFHQKYLVRVRGSQLLTYISTANATEQAHADFNVSTFYPHQDELATDIIAMHKMFAQKGTTLKDFTTSGAQLKTRKKRQRKLFTDAANNLEGQTQSVPDAE